MFELVEIAENKQFHDRIFPIVLADANIYDPLKRIEYVKYWEGKRAELAEAIRTLDPANLHGIRDDMDLYDRIRDKIAGLTNILKDMNTLTLEMHQEENFEHLYEAIEQRMKKAISTPGEEGSQDVKTKHRVAAPRENVTAMNGGIAIGNIQIGGDLGGNLVIGNKNQANSEK
jgi:hypothetical protein